VRAAIRPASASTGSRTTSRPTGPPDIRTFAATNEIELVATPTYVGYLNPVECHFSALTQFVLAHADYRDWDLAFALARHVTYQRRSPRPPPRRR
jgi:hypothetical protein